MADHPFVTAYKAARTPETARVLPENAIVSILGDSTSYGGYTFDYAYDTPEAWSAARTFGKDLGTAEAGEMLVVPSDATITLTSETATSFQWGAAAESSTYFSLILAESPDSKPTINLNNVYLALDFGTYYNIYDFEINYYGTDTTAAVHYALSLRGSFVVPVGLIFKTIECESAWGLSMAVHAYGQGSSMKNSAIVGPITDTGTPLLGVNTVGIWFAVTGIDHGVSSFALLSVTITAAVEISCVLNIADYTEQAVVCTAANVVAQNFTISSFAVLGNQAAYGYFAYYTCDVLDAVSIDDDGYTITEADENGTPQLVPANIMSYAMVADDALAGTFPTGTPIYIDFYDYSLGSKGALLATSNTFNNPGVAFAHTFTGLCEGGGVTQYCFDAMLDMGVPVTAYSGCEGGLSKPFPAEVSGFDDDIIGQRFGGEDGDEAWDRGAMAYYASEPEPEPEAAERDFSPVWPPVIEPINSPFKIM